MLTTPEKLLFLVLAAAALAAAFVGFRRVARVIARGERALAIPRGDHLPRRAGRALLRTVTQVTVFSERPWVSLFHAFVFYGFVFYLLVNLVDAAHGLLPRAWLLQMRFGVVGDLYRLFADAFGFLVLVGVAWLLARRFLRRDPRLSPGGPRVLQHEAVARGGVQRDSLIVGVFILLHVGFRLVGEGFLLAHEGHRDAWQPVASALAALIGPGDGRLIGWHVGWWGALGLILAFLPYFPRSKHLHLFTAPINLAVDRRTPAGAPVPYGVLEPLDLEDEAAERFGVSHLEHLRWPQLLDPYACIQCHRCSEACPANQTGKALSPSALEINKRYELVTNADAFAAGSASPRPLLEFAIAPEAVWACTTCGACMDVCPVGCEPMIDIVDLRRHQVMTEGEFPAGLQAAFRGLERNGNPWGLAPDRRMAWTEGLDVAVPTVAENPAFEVLFWVGCAGSYDPDAQATTRALARLLARAGVSFAVLGRREGCTGDPARRAGNEYLYEQLARQSIATLDEALGGADVVPPGAGGASDAGGASGADAVAPGVGGVPGRRPVVTACPHCFHTLAAEYPQLGGDYEVVHHTDYLARLLREGRLPSAVPSGELVTLHDPCYAGRHHGIVDAPREVARAAGAELREMPRHGRRSFCCGAGGAQFWKEEEDGDARVADARVTEATATGARAIATGCPFCRSMLSSSSRPDADALPVRDVAVMLADALERR